jgi:DNA-binding NtrC family response regulator
VRELRNAIDRMVILYDGPVLRAAWWEPPRRQPPHVVEHAAAAQMLVPRPMGLNGASMPINRRQKLDLARQLLESSGNDLTWVAAQLGIHPTTLYRWRKAGKV